MGYFIGIFIVTVPIAILAGFGSKQVASRSPRGWTWVKIGCQTVFLGVFLIAFIATLKVFNDGQDMLGLSLLVMPISAMGVLVCAGAMVGNLVGMPPRS